MSHWIDARPPLQADELALICRILTAQVTLDASCCYSSESRTLSWRPRGETTDRVVVVGAADSMAALHGILFTLEKHRRAS